MADYYTSTKGTLPKLLLFDGNNHFRRADSTPAFQFMRHNGKKTGAMYGCVTGILKDIEMLKPDEVAIAFDGINAKTEKRKIWAGYKSNRAMDDPLYQQMLETIKVLRHAGLCVLHKDKADGDDILGSLTRVKRSIIISSSDKDMFQLLNERICQMRHIDGQKQFWYADTVLNEFGIHPSQFADYLALVGDSVDTIPGLFKCGPKGALSLIKQFGTVENLVKNRHTLSPGKLRDQVNKQRHDLLAFKRLTKLDKSVISDTAMPGIIERLRPKPYDKGLFPLLEQYGQKALIKWFKEHKPTVLSKPPSLFG